MDAKQAIEILVKAVMNANRRGAFDLAESAVINDAVNVFVKKPESDGAKSDGTDSGAATTEDLKA